jgi:pilus assembly protein CpaB
MNMNSRALLMIGVSAVLGLAAMIFAAQWLGQKAALATKKVVVAAKDIQLGSPLTEDMLKAVDWPSGSMPEGATSDVKQLEARVVKTTLQRGEAILESRLAPVGTKGGLSSIISNGKRAITVKVNEVIGVAGFALPGNLVDVMVNTKDEAEKPVSKIVLEQVLVLAVAQEAGRDETKPKVVSAVTLELTPEQAERLDLARSVGNLSLVLRNQLDKDSAHTAGVRKPDLLRTAAAQNEKPIVRKPAVRGGHATRAKPTPSAPKPETPAPQATQKAKVELIKGMYKTSIEH